MPGNKQILFITWDGPGSTYLQGLFLPIFVALQERGYDFHVLQFTWSGAAERAALAKACGSAGVTYESASIWRRPVGPGALATAVSGRARVRQAIAANDIDLLLPRSTLPALAALGARSGLPMLLDADGLPNDERIDFGGASHRSLSYRLLSAIEAWSVREADAVTVRTQAAAKILAERAGLTADDRRFHVVANARDETLFAPPASDDCARRRAELGVEAEQPLIAYAGSSLVGKYNGDAVFRFFRKLLAKRPDARLLLLLPDHRQTASFLADHPPLAAACILRSAAPDEVPSWIGCADLGLALIHTSFSMQAVAPIKLGEYLLCGVPVLASAGVGDTRQIVDPAVGRAVEATDEAALADAADWFLASVLPDREGFRARCRAVGLRHFALSSAVDAYADALVDALSRKAAHAR